MSDRTPIGKLKESETRSRSEIVAQIAREELERLNADTQIGFHEVGANPDSGQSIRFGELPIKDQEAFREALIKLAGITA